MTRTVCHKIQRSRPVRWGTVLFIIICLLPALSHIAIFWFGINVQSWIMAFTDYDTGSFTWNNFAWVFQQFTDPKTDLTIGLLNTTRFFLLGLFNVPLTLFASYMIYKKMALNKTVRVLLYLPGAISGLMMAMLYSQLVTDGPLISFLNDILHMNIPVPVMVEKPLVFIMMFDIWLGLGGGLIIWFGAMGRVPEELMEYGRLEGVGPIREFFTIVMPLIWPTFVTCITLQFVGFFGASGSVLVFTQGKNGTMTIAYWMYHLVYNDYEDMYNYSNAAGLICTILTIPLVVGGRFITNRFGKDIEY